jgi:hypothetical protein
LGGGGIVRNEGAGRSLAVAIDHDFVQAEISDEGELLGRIEVYGMSVRFFLAGWIHAGVLFRCLESDETRTVALGQYQSFNLLVYRLTAVCGNRFGLAF